jgi:hypothetical protein
LVTAHTRGHLIYWDPERQAWLYADDHSQATIERACLKCKLMPTVEGFDPCLGHIPGAVSACCGHGVSLGFVVYDEERAPSGAREGSSRS